MDKKKVIIADQINEKGIEDLKEVAEVVVDTAVTQEELINKIKDFDAIIVRSRTKVTREVIEAADKLKIIAIPIIPMLEANAVKKVRPFFVRILL
jgi:D-3-phosphoglycerate dehydrogenase